MTRLAITQKSNFLFFFILSSLYQGYFSILREYVDLLSLQGELDFSSVLNDVINHGFLDDLCPEATIYLHDVVGVETKEGAVFNLSWKELVIFVVSNPFDYQFFRSH